MAVARKRVKFVAHLTQARKVCGFFRRQDPNMRDDIAEVIECETFQGGVLMRRFRIRECRHLFVTFLGQRARSRKS